jgi:hypothetical protein
VSIANFESDGVRIPREVQRERLVVVGPEERPVSSRLPLCLVRLPMSECRRHAFILVGSVHVYSTAAASSSSLCAVLFNGRSQKSFVGWHSMPLWRPIHILNTGLMSILSSFRSKYTGVIRNCLFRDLITSRAWRNWIPAPPGSCSSLDGRCTGVPASTPEVAEE